MKTAHRLIQLAIAITCAVKAVLLAPSVFAVGYFLLAVVFVALAAHRGDA